MSDPSVRPALHQLSDELADLVATVMPSIVALSGSHGDDSSSGSGFLIDDQGHAVTNFHVVDGLDNPLDAILHGGDHTPAAIVGTDAMTDLALVQVQNPPANHLTLRELPARLGELCIGLGSPFGIYPESVAMGVVSGLARRIPQDPRPAIEHALQTDVAINPGNSGGPLVDVRGEVLGVNKGVDTRGTAIGFAIPAETVRWVVEEIKANGHVERAALGVTVVRRKVQVNGSSAWGLAVTRAKQEGADGLKVDDVILRFGTETVDEVADLYRILTRAAIDQDVNVHIVRAGAEQDLTVRPTRLETST
jgi:serine protease Do